VSFHSQRAPCAASRSLVLVSRCYALIETPPPPPAPLRARHYDILPTGPWFNLLRPHLTLHQVTPPSKVWDHELKLAAHKSDIIRIYALKALGGIYLDFDVFV